MFLFFISRLLFCIFAKNPNNEIYYSSFYLYIIFTFFLRYLSGAVRRSRSTQPTNKNLSVSEKIRKPKWLKVKLPTATAYKNVKSVVKQNTLHTICESGNCPNIGECWGAGTATFMILGNICTRSCGFCNVQTGRPLSVDTNEPKNIANSVKIMKVKHAVITSVDRDDLKRWRFYYLERNGK